MSISVNVSSPAVQAVVNAAGVSASVQAAASVAASVGGGFGPAGSQGPAGAAGATGPAGPQGPAGVSQIAAATDVQLVGLAVGDVLRYSSSGHWKNEPELNLVDGGNW